MSPSMDETCANCRFWRPVKDQDGHKLGLCRRFPPAYEGWPMTNAEDWCGEWLQEDT
jgi:hypothetical protein